jgi:hypothetical protein
LFFCRRGGRIAGGDEYESARQHPAWQESGKNPPGFAGNSIRLGKTRPGIHQQQQN